MSDDPSPTAKVAQLQREIDLLAREVQRLEGTVGALGAIPPGDQALTAVAAGQEQTQRRLDDLEAALAPDLPDALQIPLLRRDIDNLQRSVEAADKNLQSHVDGTRTLVFGTIGVLALGLLTQALNSLFRRNKTEPA